jgi:hypothetical protein
MHTLQHGFWVYFFTRRHPRVGQFVLGAVFSDFIDIIGILYLLGTGRLPWGISTFQMSPAIAISYLRGMPWVNTVEFAAHSLVVWVIVFMLSSTSLLKRFRAFIIGWGTHVVIDILTHMEHAPYLFYPLSWRQIPGIVQYWDIKYHGLEFRWVQAILTGIAILYLIYEYSKRRTMGGQ